MKKGKAEEAYEIAKILEEDLKVGDHVKFASGHPLDGTLGVVAALNPDGTIGVRVGKALQEPVAQAMLIKQDAEQSATSAQAVSTATDAAPTA